MISCGVNFVTRAHLKNDVVISSAARNPYKAAKWKASDGRNVIFEMTSNLLMSEQIVNRLEVAFVVLGLHLIPAFGRYDIVSKQIQQAAEKVAELRC